MKTENWYYEFSPLSGLSPNGQFTIKEGDVGTPIACLPVAMLIDLEKAKLNQETNAKLISQSPIMYKWCMKRLKAMQKVKDAGLLDPKVLNEYKELLAIKKATE